ncbi:MAG: hypothetical protein FWG77_12510 [Treponema sp.]|nr:hypothetical protein [Treponema sp.]
MFEGSLNIVVVVIALVVFVGRTVLQVRAKKKEAAQPQENRVNYREEEDDEDDDRTLASFFIKRDEKEAKESAKGKPAVRKPPAPAKSTIDAGLVADLNKAEPAPRISPVSAQAVNRTSSLNHLSTLKHAVIMAEILGPPKSLREE